MKGDVRRRDVLKTKRAKRISGSLSVPGDKSVSHRAAIIGAIARGQTTIANFSPALDCRRTLECLEAIGARPRFSADGKLIVEGLGLRGLREPQDVLDVGNSGTTLRVLPGVLAGQEFFSVITGDASVRGRPMARVIDPLRDMGARITGRRGGSFAPLAIDGRVLHGTSYRTPVPSAQVKTAILLAGLLAEGRTTVAEISSSRDHTERMLKHFGAAIDRADLSATVTGGKQFEGADVSVPGDLSSAAFFLVAVALVPGSSLILKDVGVNPTRTGIIEALTNMGAEIQMQNLSGKSNEPRADLFVKSAGLHGTTVEGELIPQVIDELPVLAVAATQAEGRTVVRNARELRVKESDRIATLVSELRKLGAKIEELDDGFMVEGPVKLKGAPVESHGDHRIAMALAIAGLVASGTTSIHEPECIDVSFPDFERSLASLLRESGR